MPKYLNISWKEKTLNAYINIVEMPIYIITNKVKMTITLHATHVLAH
jgi:hypothetical protein